MSTMNTTQVITAYDARTGIATIGDTDNATTVPNVSREDSAIEGPKSSSIQEEIPALEINTTANSQVPASVDVVPAEIHDFDMLIIGAGISGINMAYRYQESFPKGKYIILEQRENMGGTWDLMRYPGIRSDSDLYTFGFAWRPWPEKIPIAEGGAILKYMKESAAQYDIDKKILLQHKVKASKWSSREQAWTLTVEVGDGISGEKSVKHYRGKFMVLGTGYYNYEKPLEAKINGIEKFKGRVVHPQFWPKDLNYAGKKVAVIGSGATTITLIPALAKTAERVTMVQRSPSYIVSMPNRKADDKWWEKLVPVYLQRRFIRFMYLFMSFFMRRMMRDSSRMRKWLVKNTKEQLPATIPFDPHFKPTYAPWTQRICLCPDGDFFAALRIGKAGVATGVIETMTENSIILESGETVDADIIITATGLHLAYGGNSSFHIDNEPLDWSKKFFWRGAMLQDVPNLMLVQGYSTASWTLGADATAHMTCRLLRHLQKHQMSSAVPRVGRPEKIVQSGAPGIMGLTSTYIVEAKKRLPMHGERDPWRARGDYLRDMWFAKWGDLRPGLSFVSCVKE